MKESDLNWCLGFFESQASFTVNIGLPKTKNKRYFVFKPYIVIANTDENQVEYVREVLDLNHSVASVKKKKQKYHNDTFSLNIQNFEDIDKILEVLSSKPFKSSAKQGRLDRFRMLYAKIKDFGHIHTVWDDKFESLIEDKLNINKERSNINKNRFSAEQWVKKIKEHLEGISQ